MINSVPTQTMAFIAGFLIYAAVSSVTAQEPPNPADTAAYKIDKILPALIDSPEINAGNYKKQTRSKSKWLEVDLAFERDDRDDKSYSGDVRIDYFILLNNAKTQPDSKPTLLTGSISHSDIPVDKSLHAAAFVSPRALAKLFGGKTPSSVSQTILDLGVTITANEQLVAIKTLKGSIVGDQGWWDTELNSMTSVTGLVLEKEKTPFAHLSWDYYLPTNSSP